MKFRFKKQSLKSFKNNKRISENVNGVDGCLTETLALETRTAALRLVCIHICQDLFVYSRPKKPTTTESKFVVVTKDVASKNTRGPSSHHEPASVKFTLG